MKELQEKIKQINIEDFIWLIYIGIIFLSWYSNSLERDFYLNKNLESKQKYQKNMILIFAILIVVYFYFLESSYKDLVNLKPWDTNEKKDLVTLSFLASLLIAISGAIFLYIAFKDENLDVELAFN